MMKLWNRIHIHSFTYILVLMCLLCGLFKYVLIISSIVFIHEIGHILMCLYFKRNITSIELLPFGGLIKIDSYISENIYEDLLISISGIGMQVIFGFILYIFNMDGLFRMYNILIILFNLLPLCPLDGYKIVKLSNELYIPYKKTFIISFIISILFFLLIIFFKINIIYDNTLVFIFIILSTINEYKNRKYYLVRFYLERVNHKFCFNKININDINNMYKNKLHIIKGIDEREYLKREVFSKII